MSILFDQGFPVEYELDKFNTPHTGTILRHPQNWLCRLQCRISLRHVATTSPLGNIFWRHSRFSPKQKYFLHSTITSFLSYETCNTNVNSLFHAAIKNLHVKANGIFVFLLLHPPGRNLWSGWPVCGHKESKQNALLEWPGSRGLWPWFWNQNVGPVMFLVSSRNCRGRVFQMRYIISEGIKHTLKNTFQLAKNNNNHSYSL